MIRLVTLGRLDLTRSDGGEMRVILAQPRRAALLAYLAVAAPRGFQSRDRLLPLFWPDHDSRRARAALNRAVYFLRKHLGEGVLGSRGDDELALNFDRFWCDVPAFEEALDVGDAARALDVYHGDLLPGFFPSRAPGFERWLERERARLRERAASAAWAVSAAEEARGNFTLAAALGERAMEFTAFGEVAARRVLRLFDRAGDRVGAAQFYKKFSHDVAEQLELTPSLETRALIEDIRGRDREAVTLGSLGSGAGADSIAGGAPVRVSADVQVPSGLAPPALAVPRRSWRRRAWPLIAAIAVLPATAMLANWRRQTIDPLRVEVATFENRTGTKSLRRLGDVAAARMVDGIRETGLVRHVGRAPFGLTSSGEPRLQKRAMLFGRREVRAGTIVTGAYYLDGSTLRVHAWVTDARRRTQPWAVAPVGGSVEVSDEIIDHVRRRVVGAVSVLGDSSFATLLPAATAPPIFEAYQEFLEGARVESARPDEAIKHYRWAATADSTFTWPLVRAAFISIRQGAYARCDSALKELDGLRDRLPALQRHLLNYLLAVRTDDWEASYRAMREAAALAPLHYGYLLAVNASHVNRPQATVEALSRAGLDSGSARDIQRYWFVLTQALHQLGDHRSELRAARRARRYQPQSASALSQEITALAALGRVAAVRSRLDTLLSLPRDGWFTPADAMLRAAQELRTHGNPAASADAAARAIAWLESRPLPERESEERQYRLGDALYFAARWGEAESTFRELNAKHPDNVDYVCRLGTIAARRGDRATARAVAARLAGMDHPTPVPGEDSITCRAKIAALLGDFPTALRYLIDAFGAPGTNALHGDVDFESLNDYERFRDFIKPKG